MNTNEAVKNQEIKSILIKAAQNKFILIISFSFLTAIAAQITIPVKPVPFTLQTAAVLLSGALLGPKNGAYSQIFYLFLGIIGLPVFAQIPDVPAGLARLFGPTGGYLLAFPFASLITGYLISLNKSYPVVVASMFIGALIILFIGTIYLNIFYINNFEEAVKAGAAIFSVWTVAKVFVSATIFSGIRKIKS